MSAQELRDLCARVREFGVDTLTAQEIKAVTNIARGAGIKPPHELQGLREYCEWVLGAVDDYWQQQKKRKIQEAPAVVDKEKGIEDLPCEILLHLVAQTDPNDYKAMRTASKKLQKCLDTGHFSGGEVQDYAKKLLQEMKLLDVAQHHYKGPLYLHQYINAGGIPSERVQLEFAKTHGSDTIITLLENYIRPSETVFLAAIDGSHPITLKYFFHYGITPSEKIQLALINDMHRFYQLRDDFDNARMSFINTLLKHGIPLSNNVQAAIINIGGVENLLEAGIIPSHEVLSMAVKQRPSVLLDLIKSDLDLPEELQREAGKYMQRRRKRERALREDDE